MATNPSTLPENSGRITAPDANYPYGSAKNDSTGTTGDGTPIRKPLMDDTYGFYQAVLSQAGIVPSGIPETALVSQILEGLLVLNSMQSPGIVGASSNASMQIATASATGTFTATEAVVGTTLTGRRYRLANISETINLATTGAGGMDVGLAPASGYVALYLIYNPTTLDVALLARDATSVAAPEIYGGANMPAGYTASALVGVIPTNASRQFVVCQLRGRRVSIDSVAVLNASATQRPSPTSQSIASAVPLNAKACSGLLNVGSSATSSSALNVGGNNLFGVQGVAINHIGAGAASASFSDVPIRESTPQTIVYTATVTGGTMSATIIVGQYEF